MKTVDVLGATAVFREADDLRARDVDLIEAASLAAASALAKLPTAAIAGGAEAPEGETEEQKAAREAESARLIGEAMAQTPFSLAEALALAQLRRATIVATLESWTLREPLPTMDTIGDLPRKTIEALDQAIGGMGSAINRPDFQNMTDPESPTSPSSDSSSQPEGDPQNPSTPASPEDTASTGTENSSPV
jgi:hypothetical protein